MVSSILRVAEKDRILPLSSAPLKFTLKPSDQSGSRLNAYERIQEIADKSLIARTQMRGIPPAKARDCQSFNSCERLTG